MPKKLMDCVERVKKSGKSESEAWAICISSTGLKPHKEKKGEMLTKEQVQQLVVMANKLDESGLHQEANEIDELIVRSAGILDWLKSLKGKSREEGKQKLEGVYTKLHKGMLAATERLRDRANELLSITDDLEVHVRPDVADAISIQRWTDRVAKLEEDLPAIIEDTNTAFNELKRMRVVYQKFSALAEEALGVTPAGEVIPPKEEEPPPPPPPPAPEKKRKPKKVKLFSQEMLWKGYQKATPEIQKEIHTLVGGPPALLTGEAGEKQLADLYSGSAPENKARVQELLGYSA